MVKLIWTEFAIEDLELIHEYISKHSKVYALKIFQNHEELFRNLILK